MALNKWIGMGRITAPIELKTTQSGTSVATFTIAVDRDYKGQNGEKQTDFINIVAWRSTAEFVSRYFGKGNLICVVGSLQTRSYDAQDGSKRYVTEIAAESVHFTGEKKENSAQQPVQGDTANFQPIENDEELPF